jgi:hypothetical protein
MCVCEREGVCVCVTERRRRRRRKSEKNEINKLLLRKKESD